MGKQFFIRGNRTITLTAEGMMPQKRAEEIIELVRKTEDEITFSEEDITSNVNIGVGEAETVRILARAAKSCRFIDVNYL